jgi:hypothetical protein
LGERLPYKQEVAGSSPAPPIGPPRRMEPAENTRARALIAIGALLALGVLVAVVVLAGSGSDEEAEAFAAPEKCIEGWNSDSKAVASGLHNFQQHGYTQVQVAYASADGSELGPDRIEGGGCVVVFAASQLDPEPVAAAEIQLDDEWAPLSATADPARLAELQSAALGGANATLGTDGRISPL